MMDETLERGEGKNFEIQPDGPVFDVVEIALDAFFSQNQPHFATKRGHCDMIETGHLKQIPFFIHYMPSMPC